MKHLILIGDGMADFPLDNLAGRTPLEAAATPAMDEVARRGVAGLFCPIPEDLPPGSDIGNLSLFGYNPHETFTGRAPIEAAQQGIALEPDEVAFRCNLVTLCDSLLKDFTAGHISSEEARQLVSSLNDTLGDLPAVFHAGVSYRHIAVVSADRVLLDQLVAVRCTPPHDILDQQYRPYLPQGPGAELLCEITERSQGVLADHPVNLARTAAGKPSANSVWLWGQGRTPAITTYHERFGLTGAVISAVDLVKGIGVCAGLEVIAVSGATGYLDTNYEGKVRAALEALDRVDVVFVHVEAPDEAGHEGRPERKVQAIEDFDRRVVAPCLEHMLARRDCRMLVAPDHITAISTRTHTRGPVPFAMCGQGVTHNGCRAYTEREAGSTGLVILPGYRLVPAMLTYPEIDQDALARLGA